MRDCDELLGFVYVNISERFDKHSLPLVKIGLYTCFISDMCVVL